MERVTFLIEDTGERVSCLLNPESLTLTRRAGLRERTGRGGALTGAAGSHDPLIATGGGVTELELHLLFDTELARSLDPRPAAAPAGGPEPPRLSEPDVRDLTRPLLNLAEPAPGTGDRRGAAVCRFIWGTAWNLPVVVLVVAERLERFGPDGVPGRSWMSLRLRQVPESESASMAPPPPAGGTLPEAAPEMMPDAIQTVADPSGQPSTPLYLAALWLTGDPENWPRVAEASGIEDPPRIEAGTILTAGPTAEAAP